MEPVVGIFTNSSQVQKAAESLKEQGFGQVTLLTPGEPKQEIERAVPTEDMEQPGMGSAIGGVIGGAVGIAGGMELGAAAASLIIPGIGPVMAAGFLGAALLGAGGVAAGVAAGQALETSVAKGLPKDELFLYEDALRQGRSVLIVWTDEQQRTEAGGIMRRAGAESLDAARERWWVGLRSAEEEQYRSKGRDFSKDEKGYRRGFEAALHADLRNKSYHDALEQLREKYGNECQESSFQLGYERGLNYYRSRQDLGSSTPNLDRS
jgi:rhodanese-related sulfurtransferase